MKRNVLILLMLTVALCLTSVGCRKGVPITEPGNPSISAYGKFTKTQVRDAILRGGSNIGWQMREEVPGVVLGTWNARSNSVTVKIPYSEKEYTIKYHSSENMLDGGDGTIHTNYNRWVDHLNRNITAEIGKIKK